MKKWDAGSIVLWLGHGMYDKTLGPCLVVNESQSDPNKYEDDCRNDRVVFTKPITVQSHPNSLTNITKAAV